MGIRNLICAVLAFAAIAAACIYGEDILNALYNIFFEVGADGT